MSDDQAAAFDNDADVAWRQFRTRLTTSVARLQRDEFIELSRTESTRRPLLIFSMTGAGRMRCTVGDMALTNFWPSHQAPAAPPQTPPPCRRP